MRRYLILAAALGLAACSDSGAPAPAASAGAEAGTPTATTAAEQAATELNALLEEAFDEFMALNPVWATFLGDNTYNDQYPVTIGPEHRAKMKAYHERWLAKVREIDVSLLQGQALLSYEIFVQDREEDLERFDYPFHLVPINQFYSSANSFARLGSGGSFQPFKTVEDYENFLGRVQGFDAWVDQAITNMREGMDAGVVQPAVLMERVVPQLEAHVVDDVEESIFYRPVTNMPEEFPAADRERLAAAYTTAIGETLVPAYARLRDFVRDEYIPACRGTSGLGAAPGGEDWYAFLVRQHTTTNLTPEEIHQIGLSEVKRIHGEMRGVMAEVGFEGDLKDFFTFMNTDPKFFYDDREELLAGYRALREPVNKGAERLFSRFPKADYEIRAVEPFREKSAAGGSYQSPSPDGSRPGIFYVNTYDMGARPKWAMESLFLHEAVPGHHFQNALQMELMDLPRFRRYGGYTAFGEGWALYTESLGKEIGIYTDPYQYFGALNAELWRAVRLVVDTGLHYKGWSREDVLEFMYENSAVAEARAVAEAERYMAIPGQALSYKIGQLKILELRARAEEALGENFDIRDFHAHILEDGELPLGVLEAKTNRWIEGQMDTAGRGAGATP